MRDYPTLHFDTHLSKGTVVRKDIDVNYMRDYLTLHLDTN